MIRRAPVIGLAAVCLALLSASSAAAIEPIEGSWFYSGGEVLVEATGPGTYKGTVVKATTFSSCTHPVGERMWEINGSGTSYTGTHDWFFTPSCATNPDGQASWVVKKETNREILEFCTVEPGKGAPGPSNPNTSCDNLERASAPQRQACAGGAGTSQSSQQVCIDGPADLRNLGCLRRGAFLHRFRIKLKKRSSGGGLVNRRSRVRIVKFTLDGKRNGSDRKRPFLASVRGATLTPGAHVLRATVDLRVPNSRTRFRRKIAYRFNGCA